MNVRKGIFALSLLVAGAAQAGDNNKQLTPPPPPPLEDAQKIQRTPPPPPPLDDQKKSASHAESMMDRLNKPQKRDLATVLRMINGQTVAHAQAGTKPSAKPVKLKSALYTRRVLQPKVESKQ